MPKKNRKNKGGFFRSNQLTSQNTRVYDVLAINEVTGLISTIGQVTSIDEAVKLKKQYLRQQLKYYMLENATVLKEL